MTANNRFALAAEAEYPAEESSVAMPRDMVLHRMLDWLFTRDKGCHNRSERLPLSVAKRAFALAKWLEREDLLDGLNQTDIARIFNESRASPSARVKTINRMLAANGGKATTARFQRPHLVLGYKRTDP